MLPILTTSTPVEKPAFLNNLLTIFVYFSYKVLGISEGINQPGGLRYDLALYLFIAWVICYLCIFKGVKWTGKVS